jgi:hypothetical protein
MVLLHLSQDDAVHDISVDTAFPNEKNKFVIVLCKQNMLLIFCHERNC